MKVDIKKYKTMDPKGLITFNNPWQYRIHPLLAGRIAYLASVKKKTALCTSGFRSDEEQLKAQRDALTQHKDYRQGTDGRVYNSKGQCMVSAIGQSSHNWGLAFDSSGTWIEKMTDAELRQYGLRKAMSYEPWHIEPVETTGMSLADKKTEFYEYMGGGYYPMDVKTFQMITGLKPDGAVGPKTKGKAAEVNGVIRNILTASPPVKTGAEAIKWLADNKVINGPDYWNEQIKVVKNLDLLLVKIVNEVKG